MYYIYIYIFKRDSNGRNSKMYSYKTLFLHILYTYCTACVCRFSIITCFRAVTYAHIYSLSLCLKARSSIALYTHPTYYRSTLLLARESTRRGGLEHFSDGITERSRACETAAFFGSPCDRNLHATGACSLFVFKFPRARRSSAPWQRLVQSQLCWWTHPGTWCPRAFASRCE